MVEDISVVRNNYESPPLPQSRALPAFSSYDPLLKWQPVKLTGTYDVGNQLIVRNRPFNGQPGYEVLTPLRLEDGTAVVIDRGWLPIGDKVGGRPDTVPAPPEGTVTVIARLRPAEPDVSRGAPTGQIASINLAGYAGRVDYPLRQGAYALLVSETPRPAAPAPLAFPKPSLDEGPHLSYGMQWFAFGALLFVGFGYAARQERRVRDLELADDNGSAGIRQAPGPLRGKSGRRTAEEEEDAILDAQGIS